MINWHKVLIHTYKNTLYLHIDLCITKKKETNDIDTDDNESEKKSDHAFRVRTIH